MDEYEQNTQTKKRSCYERLTRENQEKPFAVARIMDPSVSTYLARWCLIFKNKSDTNLSTGQMEIP